MNEQEKIMGGNPPEEAEASFFNDEGDPLGKMNNDLYADRITYLMCSALSKLKGQGMTISLDKFDEYEPDLSRFIDCGLNEEILARLDILLKVSKIINKKYNDYIPTPEDITPNFIMNMKTDGFYRFNNNKIFIKKSNEENVFYARLK